MIKAVIFDMDGTLVDSERVSQRAWAMAAERLGVDLDPAHFRTIIGQTRESVIAHIGESVGSVEVSLKLYDMHNEIFDEICGDELTVKPGAHECIAALREAGYAIGLATSTLRSRAMVRLGMFNLQDAFDRITCGEEVEHGKPEPDIFLLAAERLGAAPGECVVVEDSSNGVRAGHAAGAHVLMVPDLIEPTPEISDMCDAVLSSLHEVPAAVASMR